MQLNSKLIIGFVFSCFLVGLIQSATPTVNNRPIIGILSQPTNGGMQTYGAQYIAASYVKFVESGGARVVPILYDSPTSTIIEIFNSINGLLLPGGGVDFDTEPVYVNTMELLFNLAIKANNAGDYFPIWGTCMGFQELSILASGNYNLLTQFNSQNYTVPLNFTTEAYSSKMFSMATPEIMNSLATLPITMNNHNWGVSPQDFVTSKLTNFYTILSYNNDRNGKTFVSTIEAINYPIYGAQWHPEKPLFEWWDQEVINHSYESVIANQYTTNFFVNEARKNFHSFPSQAAETSALIYNYQPVFSFPIEQSFEQVYYFPPTPSSSSVKLN
eukprot:gene1921-2356_t